MHSVLTNFQVIRPKYQLEQEKILEWIARAHTQAEGQALNSSFYQEIREKLLKIGLGPEKIQSRGFEMYDCFHENWHEMEVYNLNHHPRGFGFQERSSFYDKTVTNVFEKFYPDNETLPDNLIHVTCTGYVTPSGAQKLVANRGFGAKTAVTHAYHMGCYASIPAIRMGVGFASSVDIVHTELCSIHMNPLLHDMGQLVVYSLFADGYIKYSLSKKGRGLKVLALHEEIIPDSIEAMSWSPAEWGMKMTLIKDVPVLIARALPGFLAAMMKKAKMHDLSKALFAIHPGGPKIIEQVGKILKLEPFQLAHSESVMKNYGNMSSATLPHIWHKILNEEPEGTYIVSLAYGPGLSISGGILQCGS